jgi:internalin A
VRENRIQEEAVGAIRRAGGSVAYDWEWNLHRPNTRCPPRWLVDFMGADYFGHVTLVTFYKPTNDAALAQVGRLVKLQGLDLSGSPITDAGLAHLVGLNTLCILQIRDAHVSDAGLAHLKGLAELEGLNLMWVRITDAGLVHLSSLSKLSWLDLCHTAVTDGGLAHLRTLRNLSTLHVSGTRITRTGLDHLKGLNRLRSLSVPADVTDEELDALKRALPELQIHGGGKPRTEYRVRTARK